jgi:plasmid stabilization system protein ParE
MKLKVEYSQIVRKKMKVLKKYLTDSFGENNAKKGIKQITSSIKKLGNHPDMGIDLSGMFGVDTDYKYLYVNHNYMFYYVEEDKVIVAEMFDEREDFMYKLFGISSESEESVDYWGE